LQSLISTHLLTVLSSSKCDKIFAQADQKDSEARRATNRSFGGVYPERNRRAQDRL